ncbi:MAG TPA: bifunctional DNA-formamidopyrimidine glycosylase/DNA-(apurinic or apyrimidinic site) lyase [Hyphomicrobiales bacterium]|nr:bifunctional DNA-formamidopyrimidine glycosylase/DNA-(apurinic or apyrimidinic site) lyase [Hyphomicrobiales bacterium]
MPELPEVETVRRGLAGVMEGALLTEVEQRRADLRFPFPEHFCERLAGATVTALRRRAKYLLADLDSGETLIMHMGMSGAFRVEAGGKPERAPGEFRYPRGKQAGHDHVVFRFAGDTRIVYNDPRRFGFMTLGDTAALQAHPLLAALGVEPLGNALDPAYLNAAFLNRRTSVKAALIDQRVIAGLGNIYACEALFRARISPRRLAGSLARLNGGAGVRLERLVAAVRAVLNEAIEAGGSSLRDYMRADGSLGYFQHRFSVYDREGEPCPRESCPGRIKRVVQAGRSTFYCPACQR